MKIRRDISSIPQRSARETWQAIIDLLTGAGSVDAGQFQAASSVMEMLITDEVFKDKPLMLVGVSHRVVIYLRFGPDALENGNGHELLGWNPTQGDWTLYVPCQEEQVVWTRKTLAERAPRLVVVKPGEKPQEQAEQEADADFKINWGVLDQ